MSSGQAYRDRADRGERDPSYRGHYNNRGGGNFRGRGGANTGYKPRRYWDSDDFYKDERDHGHGGRGRRRRSYNSRSRSRSRSYSSRSRSRSRSPSRRGRSRTPPPPRQPEEYVPRSTQQRNDPVDVAQAAPEPYEPYVPSKDPANSWTGTRMSMTQEYVPQANGQTAAVLSQMNPYGHVDAMPMYQGMYQETSTTLPVSGQAPVGYGYGHSIIPVAQYPPQPQVAETHQYPRIVQGGGAVPPPPAISESKSSKEVDISKKKKDKRKKKKRHHSSSSSSSSSDDSSDSRRRRKGRKDNSESSSDEDKKETGSSVGLTTQQKEALLKQREGYQTKLEILEREIGKLQSKEDELIRSRADRLLIDENLKLQAELKGRCKAVAIVLEKIDDVLKMGGKSGSSGEKPKLTAPQPTTVPAPPKITQPPAEDKSLIVPDRKDVTPYDYFDNAQHWCRLCNVFPATVQQMLAHFHSKEHHDQIQQLGIDEKPWHKRSSVCDLKPVSGARKAPFRGMQFFSPVEGWYCRLCNNWMGDPHCAVEHLKSAEHNSNYMNFLEEHPDWEKKWVSDREKALGASGKVEPTPIPVKKSRFDDPRVPIPIEKNLSVVKEDIDSGKSIRVTMRNSLKGDEREEASKFSAPLNEGPTGRDSGLDEWMNKPKVSLDIDTQKFAAIVRQKHGVKDKDVREKNASPEVKSTPPVAPQISQRERDRDLKRDDRRRPDKVEMQISNRERDRGDRYRERDNRTSRRRSRSRSRSRSRERRYGRRRSRSRSRSRSRDRSDRDRRDRGHRERPEMKEAVKKLPMIGKMPLYKRPVFTKEKPDLEDRKEPPLDIPPVVLPPAKFMQKASLSLENTGVPMFGDNPINKSGFSYGAPSTVDNDRFGLSSMTAPSYGDVPNEAGAEHVNIPEFHHAEPTEDVPSGEAKSVDKDGVPAALPDDFQQALDIIYAVGGQPKSQTPAPLPVPPPVSSSTANGVSEEHAGAAAGSADYDYSSMGANGYPNYMEYQPYQQSFDGYAPVSYEELDDGPPGVGDDNPSTNVSRPLHSVTPAESRAEEKQNDPPPPGDDDMDDLRMLGIDVDDTAVIVKR